jgi:hypothetical protein
VNPLEAIINTVSGLKSFEFPTGTQASGLFIESKSAAETPLDSLYEEVKKNAEGVIKGQRHWQDLYQKDLKRIADYLAQDYRGAKWSNFNPKRDLTDVQSHIPLPAPSDLNDPNRLPSEVDYAQLQGLIDAMSDLQKIVVNGCATTPTSCNEAELKRVETKLELAKAALAVAQDNLKSLQTAQASVVTSYNNLDKVYSDFINRKDTVQIVTFDPLKKILVQDIHLGPDYGATDTGIIACTSDATPTQATTDAISYSVLYQNVPALTVSAGLLTTFLAKTQIGTTPVLNSDGTYTTYFAVTDSAKAQVFPMAFVNYRFLPPVLKTWWGQPESELVISNSISAGIGINSNTGTNQPEFFVGEAIGFGRVYIHLGAHFGRTESLGGGFQLNTKIPQGFTGSAPINWGYHAMFSIGLSVRIAPF